MIKGFLGVRASFLPVIPNHNGKRDALEQITALKEAISRHSSF